MYLYLFVWNAFACVVMFIYNLLSTVLYTRYSLLRNHLGETMLVLALRNRRVKLLTFRENWKTLAKDPAVWSNIFLGSKCLLSNKPRWINIYMLGWCQAFPDWNQLRSTSMLPGPWFVTLCPRAREKNQNAKWTRMLHHCNLRDIMGITFEPNDIISASSTCIVNMLLKKYEKMHLISYVSEGMRYVTIGVPWNPGQC